ncbi:suppressor of tumorigenicity 7 protein isoform X1 [Takifugu rubripes]|uniref:suppressor of tumorigenicity 7 protein isoform X1 n=2 Tax=Takifugu rubripes TaxID=31033 RepID=UPI0011457CB4|nr:suppressor of tumorigenicity 7 protein isoform X1 [Takifugu rubripes]XP_029696997.1 suppressor of tumorigenicity 7 protein isoform X1 [Takifugu rubripes]XP_056907408.1 suppressor of tumorigenicity 7 protein homolog isoform X1 [Takifugu flavidus]XP_056907409.1 suppressor of tumorigenicity 7 protein homolog isoform X1 [Takifugu flavidus]
MFGTESSLSMFLNTLTPKFYVALTGTSSLISGLILIFEWWYFRKYGTSFIEQVSVSHLRPLLGGVDSSSPSNASTSNGEADSSRQSVSECKVWRNPLNLFRGAEYNRYTWVTGREPLTYYDMNLSAQDHQTFFTCDSDHLRPADAIMQKAWRERNPQARISAAHEALELEDCATAYILLAEEEATTIMEAERLFKQALKAGESCYRRSQQLQHHSTQYEAQHRRDTNVLVYIKRRLAMCSRKLGRTREAVKMMRDLMKEFPLLSMFNIHENLLESLLELQNYADVQAVLAKYDGERREATVRGVPAASPQEASIVSPSPLTCPLCVSPSDISLPKSATICYTAALLKARAVSDKFSPEAASRRGLSTAEMNAVEAIHRAVEFNPHVPKYLLEMKSLILPPEHILKRGDSEAIAYAFFHLQHWKRVEGALNLLHCTWEGSARSCSAAFRMIPYPLEKGHLFYPYPICTETADRELLPTVFHEVSVYPKKELPFFILFTAGLCSFTAMLALLTHQFPELMGVFAKAFLSTLFAPLNFIMEKVESILPSSLWHQLTRI